MIAEPRPIHDTFVTALWSVEEVASGCLRFTFVSDKLNAATGEMDQVVVARLVLPVATVESAAVTALEKVRGTLAHYQNIRRERAH